jgi:hypothetical protein
MPERTLNGVFPVSDYRHVRFTTSVLSTDPDLYADPWRIYKENKAAYYSWEYVKNFNYDPFYVLSNDEWLHLFTKRFHADEFFAHATVNDVRGIILLPDYWKTPDGISLTTAKDMNLVWDGEHEYKTSSDDYDGFAQNNISKEQWETMEFAGAVFMPALYTYDEVDYFGEYWTSTEDIYNNSYAYTILFSKNRLTIGSALDKTNPNHLILPVRVLPY